jgi:hypothetical protein
VLSVSSASYIAVPTSSHAAILFHSSAIHPSILSISRFDSVPSSERDHSHAAHQPTIIYPSSSLRAASAVLLLSRLVSLPAPLSHPVFIIHLSLFIGSILFIHSQFIHSDSSDQPHSVVDIRSASSVISHVTASIIIIIIIIWRSGESSVIIELSPCIAAASASLVWSHTIQLQQLVISRQLSGIERVVRSASSSGAGPLILFIVIVIVVRLAFGRSSRAGLRLRSRPDARGSRGISSIS